MATNGSGFILFDQNGYSVAETAGDLWDLLTQAGGGATDLDPDNMTVAVMQGGYPQRALTLRQALRVYSDEGGDAVKTLGQALRSKATRYQKLAKWVATIELPAPAVPAESVAVEPIAEEPATEPTNDPSVTPDEATPAEDVPVAEQLPADAVVAEDASP